MNIADELRKLNELHQRGALTDEEFVAAKAAVLTGVGTPSGDDFEESPWRHPPPGRIEEQVARLDREWEMERERYMIAGRYGYRFVPSRAMSLMGGAVMVAFGILWLTVATSMAKGAAEVGGAFGGVADVFPLLGGVFILAGVGLGIYSFFKASQYEEAYERYQRRRADLLLAPPTPRPPEQETF
jgi:hypothetical protein